MANRVDLYVHLVWSTWDRVPVLVGPVEAEAHAAIRRKCRELRCRALAVGGMPDHVHVLVQLHPSIYISQLAQEVKGASSRIVNDRCGPAVPFRWQAGYGAFTLRTSDIPVVHDYIIRQRSHHASTGLWQDWEP
jgi:REP element-mobilizing transposase RayT